MEAGGVSVTVLLKVVVTGDSVEVTLCVVVITAGVKVTVLRHS